MDSADLAALRRANEARGLDAATAPTAPLDLWQAWLDEAWAADLAEANAMVVSTVEPDGAATGRLVLCKGADEQGFVFYTNYMSAKGRAIAANPRVGLLFPWHPLGRQVRIVGVGEQTSRAESEAYFATRPRGAQLSAAASPQSAVLASRAELESRVEQLRVEYDGRAIPCPAHWGGIRVRPQTFEFWQGRLDRLHDRLLYRWADQSWTISRLAP